MLVTGTAETFDNKKLPYKIVLKTQHKWERFNDPDSWRREYDLYMSDLGDLFSDSLRWPECYHAEMNEDKTQTQLWIEYIEGVSGNDLTIEMREKASEELGRFQGRIYKNNMGLLQNISCFTEVESVIYYFTDYRKESDEYKYLRSKGCEIPEHLRQMLMDNDIKIKEIFENVKNMPMVLSHRDFWHENIIYSDNKIILLDWDCTGWGYMFEDIIQLILDETDKKYLEEYYKKFIPAYIKGISQYIDISKIDNIKSLYSWDMFIQFGYNPVRWYMSAGSDDVKKLAIETLQKIYDMKDIKF